MKSVGRKLLLEVFEERLCPHLGEVHVAVLGPPAYDPALADVQSQPPGPTTGATPTGFASYTTLANGMPVLDSLPGAPTAIFLDFDGDYSLSNPYGDRTVSPYSEDADGTTFNTSEQRNIYEAWREVSAYFAVFDINVTTVEPASTMPKAWLAVGNNISGGYAYVNTFPRTAPSGWNASGDARTRVSGIAHELGHILGLQHQATYDQWGFLTAEYAGAAGPLHGPIMGSDYSGQVHKFIIGHNSKSAGVTTLQDDIAVIAGKVAAYQPAGGDGFRADDFGNTIAAAYTLPVSGAAQWSSGIIERMADVDAFQFTSTGGVYALSAAPDAPSGVDLKLAIYSSSGVLMATADGANNVQQLTISLPAGTFYALVSSHGNYGDVGSYFMSVSPLPAGWASTDVGTAVTGYTVYDAATGTYTVVGTGVGVTGSNDGLQYAYQPLTGDGTIVARVTNVDNTSTNALTGLTIRESTAANAREVSIGKTASGAFKVLSRGTTGGGTSTTNGAVTANTWLKLTRTGNTFTAFTSADGVNWTLAGTVSVTMASQVTIGLFTASANNHAMNVGQLTDVSVTGNTTPPTPVYNSLAAPTGLAVALGTGSGLNLSWTATPGATGYAIERSADGVTFAQIATTTGTTYANANLAGSARYFYRVSATDATGKSVPSAVASAVNRPSAVTNFSITKPSATQLVLNWRETTGETGYTISRSTDGGVTYTTIATVGANVPSYTNSGLTAGQAYTYIVTPTSALGNGVASAAVSAAPRIAAVNPTLGSPVAGGITINWADIAGEAGYRVERSTDGTTFSTLATLAANATTYTDTNVTAGATYYYRVYGTTSLTQSLNGAVVSATVPNPPAVTIADASIAEGNSGTKTLAFTVNLSGPSATPVSVNYTTTDGTAAAGADYASAFGTITFNPGETARTITVTITGDTTVEADETFAVNLSGATNATIADAQAVGTITNDDATVPAIAIGDASTTEGNAGTKTLTFTLTLSNPSATPVTVNYATADGTAAAGSDYAAAAGTVTFNPGETARTITVTITGDTTVESDETFAVNLSGAANATIANAQAVGTITNDDATAIAIANASTTEGNSGTKTLTFTLTLSNPSATPVTVNYATADGTAAAGSDYVGAAGTVTFSPGETAKTITVTITGDTTVEADETFAVNLSGAAGATIADAQGIGTITNDDVSLPAITIADASISEGDSGTKSLTFTVSLSTASTGSVTVNYATADGTAAAGSDYVGAVGTVTFNPGETAKTITVTITGDATVESDETFAVNLSGAAGATIADGQAVGTIANDDAGVGHGGPGLLAEYFNNLTLSGTPTLVRTDATVDNFWGSGSPDPSIPTNNFSARWTGFVQATVAGTYTFSTTGDDGIRLWVDGVLVVNDWSDHSARTRTSGPITLAAGQMVSIRLEYYDKGGKAVARLLWSTPGSTGNVVIPASQLFLPAPSASAAPLAAAADADPSVTGVYVDAETVADRPAAVTPGTGVVVPPGRPTAVVIPPGLFVAAGATAKAKGVVPSAALGVPLTTGIGADDDVVGLGVYVGW